MVLSVKPNIRSLCTGTRNLINQTQIMKFGNYAHLFETNTQLKRLVKTDQLNDARSLFDKMPERDKISWAAMMSGYVTAYNATEAVVLFSNMWVDLTIRKDPFVLALALKACACNSDINHGRSIHGYSVKTGFVNSVYVGSALLDMYTKSGSVSMGCRVFDEMPERNVVSWTAIITGLVLAGYSKGGLMYFSKMWFRMPMLVPSALKAFVNSGALNYGRAIIRTQTVKAGFDSASFVANTLATMYNKCGKLVYGLRMFERMMIRDVVAWTTGISSYVQMGKEEHAVWLFIPMRESGVSPNEFTFAAVISGCAGLVNIKWGEQLHDHVIRRGLVDFLSVSNSFTTVYSKCGRLQCASMAFHDMSKTNVISWSTMIAGYSQDGQCDEAFRVYSGMRREGMKPNELALASLLSVCGNAAILEHGKQLHAHVLSIGLECDVMVNSALINMYSKCGSIEETLRIFEGAEVELVSWTAMINGYAEHGYSKEAIVVFDKMSTVGLRPDYVTFIGVLSACSHAGEVDLGSHYFNLMNKEYGINPGKEHYGCMIDLLCRAGRLSKKRVVSVSTLWGPGRVRCTQPYLCKQRGCFPKSNL